MRFSRRLGRYVSRRRPPTVSYADPYAPGSADYAERNKRRMTELSGGMVRIDVGEPVKRLPSEPSPATLDDQKALPPVTVEAPQAPPVSDPPAAPAAALKVPRREHRAITRKP